MGRLLKTATALDRNLTLALKLVEQGSAGIIAQGRFSDINETLQRYCKLLYFYSYSRVKDCLSDNMFLFLISQSDSTNKPI